MLKLNAKLITPYGGELVNLVVDENEREELLARAQLPSSRSPCAIFVTSNCSLQVAFPR